MARTYKKRPITPPEERFFKHLEQVGECWEWTGYRDPNGYGRFGVDREHRSYLAHRWCFEYLRGELFGLDLDHLCRNRACVNPWHLDPVTRSINSKRQVSAHSQKTHCPQGHPYDEANTYNYFGKDGGWHRQCRRCASVGTSRRKRELRAAAKLRAA